MATVLENLTSAREAIAVKLAALSADTALGPNVSIDGVSIDRVGYLKALTEQMEQINKLIALEGGPVWLSTQAVPG